MQPLRAAIIGCGRMGSTIDDELPRYLPFSGPLAHVARYRDVPDTVLVTACDPDPGKLQAFGERWGVTALYADPVAMMRQERPDIVSVCTHTDIRHEVTLAVAEYCPRALFMEKPMAESLRQCDEILEACAARNIVTAVNCSRRWEPYFARARELAAEVIGPVRSVTAYCNGGLSHMGSHLLDLVRFLVGDDPALWVHGYIPDATAAAGEGDVSGLGLIKFAGPATAYINMVDAGATSFDVDVVGEGGRLQIGGNGWVRKLYTPDTASLGYWHLAERPFPDDLDHSPMGPTSVQDIVSCVRDGGKPRCGGVDGRAALELALALRASSRQGGARVALPYPDRDDYLRSI